MNIKKLRDWGFKFVFDDKGYVLMFKVMKKSEIPQVMLIND